MKTSINFPAEVVTNRVNPTKMALLITIIVLSIMMIITTQISEFNNQSIIPPLITMAIIACVVAAIIVALSLKRVVYSLTESPLETVVVEFAESKSVAIADAVRKNLWKDIIPLTQNSHGTAMKLEVVYSRDGAFAAYQFFSYVPHTYESCSQIFYIAQGDIPRINFKGLKG